jgi:hypothetical protein
MIKKLHDGPKYLHDIPHHMLDERRWITWTSGEPFGIAGDLFYKPSNGLEPQPDAPHHWTSFDEALEVMERQGHDGLAYALPPDQGGPAWKKFNLTPEE